MTVGFRPLRYSPPVTRPRWIVLGRSLAVFLTAAVIAACGSTAPNAPASGSGSGAVARSSAPALASGSGPVGTIRAPAASASSGQAASRAPVASAAGRSAGSGGSGSPAPVIPTAVPVTGAPASSPSPAAPTPVPATLPPVSPAPSDSVTATPSITGGTGTPAGCSGTAENRDFYAAAAQAVQWRVYCAVLPTGWFIESGSWRLRGGGQLQVAYKGPNAARLVLQEGAYCTTGASACSPRDHDLGAAAFGDQRGTLADLGPNEPADGYAIYVNPGVTPPSWSITGTNMDQATFVGIAAALLRITP